MAIFISLERRGLFLCGCLRFELAVRPGMLKNFVTWGEVTVADDLHDLGGERVQTVHSVLIIPCY